MKQRFKTDQAIFNFVKTRLLQQKRRSIANQQCQYRGENGLRCAVGWLITNDAYTPQLDAYGATINNLDVQTALAKSGIQVSEGASTFKLLDRLQGIHDHQKPYTWEASFRQFHFNEHGEYTGYGRKPATCSP